MKKAPRPIKPSNQRAVFDAIEAGGKSFAEIRKLLRATDDAERVKGMTVKQTRKATENLIYRGRVIKVDGKFMIASIDHFLEKNNVSQFVEQPAPKVKISSGDNLTIKKSLLTHSLIAVLAGAAGVSAGLVL